MRYSRVLTVLGLLAAVALTAIMLTRPAARPVRAATTTPGAALRGALYWMVQDLQRSRRFPVPHALAVPESGGTCFVAGGGCSLTPCVIPVQSMASTPTVGSGAALARPVRPITSGCPSGSATPRTVPVKGS